jgi:hypothetical protein
MGFKEISVVADKIGCALIAMIDKEFSGAG